MKMEGKILLGKINIEIREFKSQYLWGILMFEIESIFGFVIFKYSEF